MKLNKRGITLIELLITCAVAALIIGAASGAIITGYKTYNMNMNGAMSQLGMRPIMIQITKDIRKYGVTQTSPLSINGDKYTVDATTKTLKKNTIVVAYNIASINSSISNNIIQITLITADGNTLGTQVHLN